MRNDVECTMSLRPQMKMSMKILYIKDFIATIDLRKNLGIIFKHNEVRIEKEDCLKNNNKVLGHK